MKVQICSWVWCKNRFSEYIFTRLERDKDFYKGCDNIILEKIDCLWNCEKWPSVKVDKELYSYMTPAKASEIVFKNKKKK